MSDQKSAGNDDSRSLWLALKLAWELGYLIALPIVILGVGGAFLDRWLGTMPLLTITGFILASVASAISIRRRLKEILPPS